MEIYYPQYKTYKLGPFRTSEIELQDMFKAWLALSVAFAILIDRNVFSVNFLYNFMIAGLAIGVGFILHELGHKVVAQYYGCFAEFRAFNLMLALAILMSFLGFILAAPGAVMISGNVTKDRNGKISIAGPLMSLFLALVFLAILIVSLGGFSQMTAFFKTANINSLPWYYLVCLIGAQINTFIALFNMLPVAILDGKKIFQWNKLVYFVMLCSIIGMMFVVY